MAYGNQAQGRSSFSNHKATTVKQNLTGVAKTAGLSDGKREALFSTGLFAPTKEGVKSIGSVQVKEELTIPAGSYINLYAVDMEAVEGKNMPVYRIQVTAGNLRK